MSERIPSYDQGPHAPSIDQQIANELSVNKAIENMKQEEAKDVEETSLHDDSDNYETSQ